ncbi:MAG: hypothetical protein AB7I38_12005 [Dehalococcoidia bacterium]
MRNGGSEIDQHNRARVRLAALVGEHRRAQAARRGAIAIEDRRALTRADTRLAAVTRAIEAAGCPQLARLLVDETRGGAALLVALTTDDGTDDELDRVLCTYRQARQQVDGLSAGAGLELPVNAGVPEQGQLQPQSTL